MFVIYFALSSLVRISVSERERGEEMCDLVKLGDTASSGVSVQWVPAALPCSIRYVSAWLFPLRCRC